MFCLIWVVFAKVHAQSNLCTGGFGKAIESVDFGSGTPLYNTANLGFVTSFTKWNRPITNDKYYSIVNKIPNDFQGPNNQPIWHSGNDHTSGDGRGYMMLVNADDGLGEFYRATVDNLCVGGTYEFSSYLANIFRPASLFNPPLNNPTVTPPRVRFDIRDLNNNVLYTTNTGDVPFFDTLTWVQYGITFKTPASSVQLVMISTAPKGQGNDIVLDDITFRPCIPVTTSINPTLRICEKDNATFKVNVSGNQNYQYSKWQKSADGGATWTYIGIENLQNPPSTNYDVSLSLTNIPATDDNTLYRLILGTSSSNLTDPNSTCNVISDTSILRVNAYPVLKTTDPDTSCNAAVDITAAPVTLGSVLHNGTLSYYRNGTDAANGTNAMTAAEAQAIILSGKYFIRAATNNPVCADVDTVNVVIDNPQSITLTGPGPLCKDHASFTVTATTTNVSNLLWTKSTSKTPIQTGSSQSVTVNPSASDLALDSIWIKAVPNNGTSSCPGVKDSVKVVFYSPALIKLPKDTSFCSNTPSLSLPVQATVTGNPNSISWTTSSSSIYATPSTGANTQFNLSNLSTSFSVYATATTTGCTPRSDTMEVIFDPIPVVNAGADTLLCAGKQFTRSVPANSNWKYKWTVVDDGVMQDPASVTRTLLFVPKGYSYVEVTVTTKAGCTNKDDFTISVTKPPVITLPAHECIAPNLTLHPTLDITPSLGSFSWLKDGSFLGSSGTATNLPISSIGKYTLRYTYGTCVSSDSTWVTALPVFHVPDTTICEGKNVVLTAPLFKKGSYSWDGYPATDKNTHSLIATNQSVSVSLLITDSLGCQNSQSIAVLGAPIPNFKLVVSNVCEGDTGQIDAQLADANLETLYNIGHDWQKDGESIYSPSYNHLDVTSNGTYQLSLSIGSCVAKQSAKINMYPAPTILAQDNYVYCNEDPESLVLRSEFQGTQSWYSGSTLLSKGASLAVHPDSDATYILQVQSPQGCKASKPIEVKICCSPRLFVPNVITPFSSDQNSKLAIFGKYYTNFEINVFSRWGEVIFSSKDPNLTWDGNYRSEAMPIGVYAWTVTYEGVCPDFKGPYKKVGEVTVVR